METLVNSIEGILMIPVVFVWIVVVTAVGMFVIWVGSVIYRYIVSKFNY